MAVNLISVKCPECGAVLNLEEEREQAFCTYCGTQILFYNENEYIYRHIDEAELKQAETDRLVWMKQMELAEKERADAEKKKARKIKISIIMATVGTIMMMIGFLAGSATGDSDSGFYMLFLIGFLSLMSAGYIWFFSNKEDDGDKAKVPSSISDYERKSYNAIEAMFVSAGFTNVRCVALNDLMIGLFKKPGMVDSITINGREVTSGGKKFSKDAAVVIFYHSFNR